jgi:hypothetical protein
MTSRQIKIIDVLAVLGFVVSLLWLGLAGGEDEDLGWAGVALGWAGFAAMFAVVAWVVYRNVQQSKRRHGMISREEWDEPV